MKLPHIAIILATAAALAAPAPCAAQKPVTSFDQLDTRLKPGDTVWVTDAQGREIKGTIESLGPDGISLADDGASPIAASDVKAILKQRDVASVIGAWTGFIAAGGYGVALWASDPESCATEPGMCVIGVLGYGGLGALVGWGIGWGIDAARDSKREVYRAPGTSGSPQSRVSIAPVVTRRAKGVTVSFSF
jgi:hypothetical protein